MDASKENAKKALEKIQNLACVQGDDALDVKFVEEFLAAAVGRLPTQAAIDRDRARQKAKKASNQA